MAFEPVVLQQATAGVMQFGDNLGGKILSTERGQGLTGILDNWTDTLLTMEPGKNHLAAFGDKVKSFASDMKERAANLMPKAPSTPVVAKPPVIEAPQLAKAPSLGHNPDIKAALGGVDFGSTRMFADNGIHHTSNHDLGNFAKVNLAFAEVPKASHGINMG